MFRRLFALFLLAACLHPFVRADEIFLRYGKEEPGKDKKTTIVKSLRGKIDPEKNPSPAKVVYSITGGDREIEVTNISGIAFDREEPAFGVIRGSMETGNFAEAMAEYQRLETQVKGGLTLATPAIEAEYEFFGAYLPAMQLIEGSANTQQLGQIAGKLNAFITKHPQNYRFYQACEALGHLAAYAPGDRMTNARLFYGKLAAAPDSKELQYRGKLLMGRALIREKQLPAAISLLTPMVGEVAGGSRGMSGQIAQAKIALADAAAKSGKADDSLKMLQGVVDETPSSDTETHARANIALGNLFMAQNSLQEALFAFLKVDLVFSQYPEQRAEALSKLATLWTSVPNARPDRAAECAEKLKTSYAFSPWNK